MDKSARPKRPIQYYSTIFVQLLENKDNKLKEFLIFQPISLI